MSGAYIYDAIRSPRGRRNGALSEVTAVRLSAFIIDAVAERNGIEDGLIEDVIWGNVTQVGEQGGCLARAAVLRSGLSDDVPGVSVNRFCASGLEAVNLAANQIRAGDGEAYIAGGVEMMSRVPMGSDGAPYAVDPQLATTASFVPQGVSADIIATEYGFTREECDRYAVESQRRATCAWKEERFAGSVVPVKDHIGIPVLETGRTPAPRDRHDGIVGSGSFVQGNRGEHARFRPDRNHEVSASREDRTCSPSRQFFRNRGWSCRRPAGVGFFRQRHRTGTKGAHQVMRQGWLGSHDHAHRPGTCGPNCPREGRDDSR